MQFIDLKTQYQRIKSKVDASILRVLESGKYILGPEINELEEKLASYVGSKYCLAVGNGTDALLIAMMALGIKNGDEVLTTPFSFFATAEVIALLGAKIVFVDIDPRTYNIDPLKIERAITSKTKLIMPVSLYGQCADLDVINDIAAKYQLPVIEDGAQSLGSTYKGRQSCNLSTIGCTSFYPAKPLGCYGDGGACFTNNDSLAESMRMIRVHGQDHTYNHPLLGINGRMDTIQAAVLLTKLEIFPEEIVARQKIAELYKKYLSDKVVIPYIEPYNTSVYAQYTVQVPDREKFIGNMKAKGIPTAIHYPKPLHKQPVFTNEYGSVEMPIAESASTKVVSLPMHPYLTEKDIKFIAEQVVASL